MLNIERLFGQVVIPDDTAACWAWTGPTHKGYGKYAGRQAHRVVFEHLRGCRLAIDVELDHLCFQTLCVNPDHLEPVSRAENMRRRSERQTHCVNGHEFTDLNTYRHGGRRHCRACNRDRVARYVGRRQLARSAS